MGRGRTEAIPIMLPRLEALWLPPPGWRVCSAVERVVESDGRTTDLLRDAPSPPRKVSTPQRANHGPPRTARGALADDPDGGLEPHGYEGGYT